MPGFVPGPRAWRPNRPLPGLARRSMTSLPSTDPDHAPPRPAPTSPWPGLDRLVVKRGVMIGGLTPDEQPMALALAWAGLPRGAVGEREVNEALKAQLAGAACCLDVDHVELRRWLVDAGWLQRDGYGRAYQRVPAAGLPAALRALGQALDGVDLTAWVQAMEAARDAERQRRRQAWEAARSGAEAPATQGRA